MAFLLGENKGQDSTRSVSSRQQSLEAGSLPSLSANGSDLADISTIGLNNTKGSKNVYTIGPYLINDSVASLTNKRLNRSLTGMDGVITSKLSKDEGRFEIPGPYIEGVGSKDSRTSRSMEFSDINVYDPDGFGGELEDEDSADSGFSDSLADQSSTSHMGASDSTTPPIPRHAPPPPPSAGGTYPPITAKSNPPITVAQAQRRRAQSESSPPSSPPPPGIGLLSPPSQNTAHRRSSPPAPRLDQAQASPSNPVMPRLQQRHTLQVPQALPLGALRDSTSGDEGRTNSPTVSHRRTSMNLIRRHSRSINSDAYLNEVPQDGDAARRAEMVKQKLIARKRRKEEEDEDRVLVGTRVDQNHQNWVTAYNMLTGIRFTVSRTNAKIRDHELNEADFLARHKYAFDVTGSELTPSAKYDFKFKDYAPQVFKELRSMFGIDPADYLVSLTSKILLSELASPGKSKSFFYFSRDYKYIIKTVHHAEHKLLRKILPRYFEHVKTNPNTLLSQFYGLHRIKSTWGAHKTHFVVMNNLFPPHRDIHQTYDLKGSTVGRELKEEDLEKNPRATLKDLNWMRRNQHLAFGPIIKAQFIQQMERDVELLKELGIMDYSLLVGIHDLSRGNEEGLRDKTLKVYHPGGKSEKGEESNKKDMSSLQRSASNAERTMAARQLRATLRKERPVPMTESGIDMPDTSGTDRMSRLFTKDDGGIQAEHDNGAPGNEIYYLGIIDCLTKYGMVKRIEHFVKGLSHNKNAISAVKPDAYGDRFVAFMKGISKTDEEAAAEKAARQEEEAQRATEKKGRHSMSKRSHSLPRHSSSFPIAAGTSGGTDGTMERRSEHESSRSPNDEMTPEQQAAERKARRSGESSTAEDHQRTFGTVRASMHDGGNANVTLPVVEEVNGENNGSDRWSRGDGRSHEGSPEGDCHSSASMSRQASENRYGPDSNRRSTSRSRPQPNVSEASKTSGAIPTMPERAAPQAPIYGGRPPPTPPREAKLLQIDDLGDMGGRLIISPPENP